MGYTHFFPQTKEAPLDQWATLKDNLLRLYDARPCPFETAAQQFDEPMTLCDGTGVVELTEASQLFKDDPELGAILIYNGDDREGRELAHETMLLTQRHDPGFAFCKTARKPYDWFVVATLLLAEKHCPGVWEISSDGYTEEWQPVLVWLEANGFGAMKLPAGVKPRPQRTPSETY